jgi:hypothetical protein
MPRSRTFILMTFYCVALFFFGDWLISRFFPDLLTPSPEHSHYAYHPRYHHELRANFEDYRNWGGLRPKITTNSLGFKDAKTRTVPMTSDTRRILLIGDSFTEGVGYSFEQTFAGLLYRAGQERGEKIEVLNAAAASYSPVIFLQKIRYLLEIGLRFDEVVVISDISDVHDQATTYFCIDDDPRYKIHCVPPAVATADAPEQNPTPPPRAAGARDFGQVLADNFIFANAVRQQVKARLEGWQGKDIERWFKMFPTVGGSGWTLSGYDPGTLFAPLGVEGGIARSLQNMRGLADLLAAHRIPLTIVVFPWPTQLAANDRDSRQIKIWREFCQDTCKAFIDLFPPFFAEKDAHSDWYRRLFIPGDVHHARDGHRLMFRELAVRLW